MTPPIRVRPGFLGAHFAMVGPALAFAFFVNLIPLAIWIAATAVVLAYGKESP